MTIKGENVIWFFKNATGLMQGPKDVQQKLQDALPNALGTLFAPTRVSGGFSFATPSKNNGKDSTRHGFDRVNKGLRSKDAQTVLHCSVWAGQAFQTFGLTTDTNQKTYISNDTTTKLFWQMGGRISPCR